MAEKKTQTNKDEAEVKTNDVKNEAASNAVGVKTDAVAKDEKKASTGFNADDKAKRGGRKPFNRGRRRGSRAERPKPDFDQKILNIRRVVRVVKGGRRFSFSVALVVGDHRGRVGVGIGKAGDTSLAIQKAVNNAKSNLVQLKLTDGHSIPHEVKAKFNAARVMLMPNAGRGIVAGSSLRNVVELAGIKDITARVLSRSKNAINNARATVKALQPFIIARGDDAKEKKKEKEEVTM